MQEQMLLQQTKADHYKVQLQKANDEIAELRKTVVTAGEDALKHAWKEKLAAVAMKCRQDQMAARKEWNRLVHERNLYGALYEQMMQHVVVQPTENANQSNSRKASKKGTFRCMMTYATLKECLALVVGHARDCDAPVRDSPRLFMDFKKVTGSIYWYKDRAGETVLQLLKLGERPGKVQLPYIVAFEPHLCWHLKNLRLDLRPFPGWPDKQKFGDYMNDWGKVYAASVHAVAATDSPLPTLPDGWVTDDHVDTVPCCVWMHEA